jgi:hypothetical protein
MPIKIQKDPKTGDYKNCERRAHRRAPAPSHHHHRTPATPARTA